MPTHGKWRVKGVPAQDLMPYLLGPSATLVQTLPSSILDLLMLFGQEFTQTGQEITPSFVAYLFNNIAAS